MPRKRKRLPRFKRSPCPIANVLDILGDRWTLLVVRDLFRGMRLYREFAVSPEGIPTNILAERLKRLEAAGIVVREPYQDRPVRYAYTLTKKGQDLLPVVAEIICWANTYIAGTATPERELIERLLQARPELRRNYTAGHT